ncbi:DEAD/DEAH box helicase [Leeia aquatica]|uniref:DEAD/DEAH box helicase n=1 Tax=Leeia aquatica TaxID=2725557 RepID=A0A847SLW1_9NEIS|nr:DEAD/DEAH box helicase [Leeia aquatica]NLR76932.1 DEAD/DEAH box helicase [Leeia aquatica]
MTVETATPMFADFHLDPRVLRALEESGYEKPTPIQAAAIPALLEGADVMASASTGTGKTAAFLLPALQRIASTPRPAGYFGPRALVLVPTRELATQVSTAASQYGKFLSRFATVTIVGGMPYPVQNRLLSRPFEVLIATPGRLLDHLSRGRIDLSQLEMLVLDEADRMLDMGFVDDVEAICAMTSSARQTALFSATLDGAVGNLAHRLLREPQRIQIAAAQAQQGKIEQRLHYADDLAHKGKLLSHLLTDQTLQQAIIFTATKLDADDLADHLANEGWAAAALHGDMQQRERNRTLTQLRNGHVRLLVATDVAARGIDIDGISHVINYDLPKNAEDYVHRIGRTGRAGRSGVAISLVSPRERGLLSRIERFIGNRIFAAVVPGLEPRVKPRPAGGKPGAPRNGAGRGQGRGFSGPRRDGEQRSWGQRDGQSRGEGQGVSFRDGAPRENRRFPQEGRTEGAPRRFSQDNRGEGQARRYGDGQAESAPRRPHSDGGRPTERRWSEDGNRRGGRSEGRPEGRRRYGD